MSDRIVAGKLADLAPGTALRVLSGPHKIAVVRCGEDLYAIGDTCTHADVSLSEGDVDCEAREIECWKHGSTFSLETGEPQSLPATRATPVYDVEVDGDEIVVVIKGG